MKMQIDELRSIIRSIIEEKKAEDLRDPVAAKKFAERMKEKFKMPFNLQNEHALSDLISHYASEEDPITVIIGGLVFDDVVGAERSGGEGGKSDVDIYSEDGVRGISIKMASADYWESAETKLAPLVAPLVQRLSKGKGKTKIDQEDDVYVMKHDGETVSRFYFELPPEIAQEAVFGPAGNRIEAVIEYEFYTGKAEWDAKQKLLTIGGPDMKIYRTLKDIPKESYPVGVIRVGEKSSKRSGARGFTFDDIKYQGLRPAITRRKFATQGNSVKVSL
ncbi:MAG: hypothetical protein EBU84_21520 [Actinobacteria bacterium]|nr:hypothetical protein [Actinomycetota bacterium]